MENRKIVGVAAGGVLVGLLAWWLMQSTCTGLYQKRTAVAQEVFTDTEYSYELYTCEGPFGYLRTLGQGPASVVTQ